MKRYIVTIMVVISVSFGGCGYVPHGEEISIGFNGTLDASESRFEMSGTLYTGGGPPDEDQFRDVKVKLYTENGSLMSQENLGDWQLDQERLHISIETNTVPHYVVFVSEDFWDEKIQLEYYVHRDSDYAVEYATSKSELPFNSKSNFN